MDEVFKEVVNDDSFQVEDLTDESWLYRHCFNSKREKIDGQRRHPNEANFILRENEEALSFNWNKYAGPNRGKVIVGLTHSRKGLFLKQEEFHFFKYPISILNQMPGIEKVVHSPHFTNNPSVVGNPNNKSHSSVYLEGDGLQARVNLADYVRLNYESAFTGVDESKISSIVNELRDTGNNNEYHRLWDFQDELD